MSFEIRPWNFSDIPEIKKFTDVAIGVDYYRISELENIFEKSKLSGQIFSLLLIEEQNSIQGIRITYPQTKWEKGKGKGLSPEKWGVPFQHCAYFQSLFVSLNLTGQGWGHKMSLVAIELLKKVNAKAIVTHSWKESPNDSSGKYLRKLGFQIVSTHPRYWFDVDYECTRCGRPCVCTAEEMILKLN